jgi:hypothetical protein
LLAAVAAFLLAAVAAFLLAAGAFLGILRGFRAAATAGVGEVLVLAGNWAIGLVIARGIPTMAMTSRLSVLIS